MPPARLDPSAKNNTVRTSLLTLNRMLSTYNSYCICLKARQAASSMRPKARRGMARLVQTQNRRCFRLLEEINGQQAR